MNDDERLQKTFEKLRKDDARRAPTFEALRRRPSRRRTAWAVVVPLASAAAAAAVFLLWCSTSSQHSAPASTTVVPAVIALGGETLPAAPVEEAPLDFLLDIPGPGLHGTPNFDTSLLGLGLRPHSVSLPRGSLR